MNDPEARTLSAVWIEAERLRTAFCHVWSIVSTAEKKTLFTPYRDCDEKWIHYDNPKRRKSWSNPGHTPTSSAKPNNHGSKLLLRIWWHQQGVINYELLKTNETIKGDHYRLQLMDLSRSLKEKRPLCAQRHDKVILLHENPRPHVAKPVKTYLETLQWEVLLNSPYSPDISPSDFYPFRSMTHGLADQRFHS